MKGIRDKFEKFLIILGATYITHTRMKIIEGKETEIPCITIGFPRKTKPDALMNESQFWKLFEEFQKGKLPGPESVTRVIDALGHSLAVVPVMIPKLLDGIQSDIIEQPVIDIPKPISGPAEHQKKYRPVPGGVSFIACGSSACSSHFWVRGIPGHDAHKDCPGKPHYGTIKIGDKFYTGCWHLGECWHCGMSGEQAGHPWAQPSPMDGGICPDDVVAYLHNFIISVRPYPTANEFDYLLTNAADLKFVSADILDFGPISIYYPEPLRGWECWSSSRTTGLTSGKINATEVTLSVNYGSFLGVIKHCIDHGAKIAGGSSGSSFLARPTKDAPIGIAGENFAGSATQNFAIALPAVARDYGVEFDWLAHPDEAPECNEGDVKNIVLCLDGVTWKERDRCVGGKWVHEIQTCPGEPPECEEGDTRNVVPCPDGTWKERDRCVGGKWIHETQACPPECEEGQVRNVIYCGDGVTWKERDRCIGGKWVHETQPCPEEPPKDCYSQFLDCIMEWDGSDLNYLLNCLMGLVTCLVMQGQVLTKPQKQQILSLISAKIGKTKAQGIMTAAGIELGREAYRGGYAWGALLGLAWFGTLTIWFPGALPMFTFFCGLAMRAAEHYFKTKESQG